MFAIGETKAKVVYSKLELPKEYNLKKKNRKIYGVWVGERLLYLSDEIKPLKAKAGHNGSVFEPNIDYAHRITVPSYLEQSVAYIRGCISTIQIEFNNKEK